LLALDPVIETAAALFASKPVLREVAVGSLIVHMLSLLQYLAVVEVGRRILASILVVAVALVALSKSALLKYLNQNLSAS
jgi:ABC-type protease/lipase transport system fused ATPase/permease subunit